MEHETGLKNMNFLHLQTNSAHSFYIVSIVSIRYFTKIVCKLKFINVKMKYINKKSCYNSMSKKILLV